MLCANGPRKASITRYLGFGDAHEVLGKAYQLMFLLNYLGGRKTTVRGGNKIFQEFGQWELMPTWRWVCIPRFTATLSELHVAVCNLKAHHTQPTFQGKAACLVEQRTWDSARLHYIFSPHGLKYSLRTSQIPGCTKRSIYRLEDPTACPLSARYKPSHMVYPSAL